MVIFKYQINTPPKAFPLYQSLNPP